MTVLYWALIFFVVALWAAAVWLGSLVATMAMLGKWLFVTCTVLALVSFVTGVIRRQ